MAALGVPEDRGTRTDESLARVDQPNFIGDWRFDRDLKRLKQLRLLIFQQAVDISGGNLEPISLGCLNVLKYRCKWRGGGRDPTEEEWSKVELLTQTLFTRLSDPLLRRRFILGDIPGWIAWLPVFLAPVAVGVLILAVVFQSTSNTAMLTVGTVSSSLAWLAVLGAIGSVAFIGMNALSIQQDITFDLRNYRLLVLRIVLGALFGLVLSLPFGIEGFGRFVVAISKLPISNVPISSGGATREFSASAILLLLPFVFGFSTSLVIMVLNRLVDSVNAFFGKSVSGVRDR